MMIEKLNTTGMKLTPKHNASGELLGNAVTYVTKKEYGERHGLKGAALTRAHLEYRRTSGLAMNADLSSAMAKGAIVAQRVTPTATGMQVLFIDPAKLVPKATKSTVTAERALATLGITAEDLAALRALQGK